MGPHSRQRARRARTFSAPRAILVWAVSSKALPTTVSLTRHLQIDLRVLTASALCWGLAGPLTVQSGSGEGKPLSRKDSTGWKQGPGSASSLTPDRGVLGKSLTSEIGLDAFSGPSGQ